MSHSPDHTPGGSDRFPVTRHSAILALRSTDASERKRAFDVIAAVYWRPAYAHIRRRWNRTADDALDLAQGFFLIAQEKDYFEEFDPHQARFRTFFRMCLDRYIQREDTALTAQKRGGGLEFVDLDTSSVEEALIADSRAHSPDAQFDLEWVRSLLSLATDRLREHCLANGRENAFAAFQRYDLESSDAESRPTYESIASDLDTTVTDITNQLAYARREFRDIVLSLLRELTSSESEFQEEARALLGIDIQ